MKKSDSCVIIPTYNNDLTLASVIVDVLNYSSDILVVNDGSTDTTQEILSQFQEKIHVISYSKNRGKGYALKRGFDYAQKFDYKYALTFDADGQHLAKDIPLFTAAIQKHAGALIIGNRNFKQENIPPKNIFANKFSNFWFLIETGIKLQDTQTGFRLYPLENMKKMRPFTNRYESELEILVRCAWRGIQIVSIPVNVYYMSKEKRVSHFRPGIDFFRISLLNTLFVILAILYGYPVKLIRRLFKF